MNTCSHDKGLATFQSLLKLCAQSLENQLESEVELVAVAVARFQDEFAGQFDQIWKFVGRELLRDTFHALGKFSFIAERQV